MLWGAVSWVLCGGWGGVRGRLLDQRAGVGCWVLCGGWGGRRRLMLGHLVGLGIRMLCGWRGVRGRVGVGGWSCLWHWLCLLPSCLGCRPLSLPMLPLRCSSNRG